MRVSEARAFGELGGQLAAGVAGWAEGLHDAVVSRVLPGPGGVGGRAKAAHDAVVGRTYGAGRALGGAAGAALGAVLAPMASGSPLSGSPTGGQVISTLNAAAGDRLHDQGSPLALPMALRSDGKDIDLRRAALDTAFPDVTGRLVLFVHGLAETDLAWMGRDGTGRPWSYAHALQPTGWTGATVRYNTGRHIADSGESLGSLLETIVAAWPVPVTDVALVGHSLGGLVIRAACASSVAAGHAWPGLVRSCVYLGSPHHGAVLEQGADVVGRVLGDIAQAGPLATLLRLRSAGNPGPSPRPVHHHRRRHRRPAHRRRRHPSAYRPPPPRRCAPRHFRARPVGVGLRRHDRPSGQRSRCGRRGWRCWPAG